MEETSWGALESEHRGNPWLPFGLAALFGAAEIALLSRPDAKLAPGIWPLCR